MLTSLVINLPPELAGSLQELARQTGITPEDLVVEALRDRLGWKPAVIEPRDEWERLLLQIGTPCGVSLSDEDLSRERIYE
jgi:predicted transcriptional regulator